MKRFVFALVGLLSFFYFPTAYADSTGKRQDAAKMSKKELNEKASKFARKEAKKLEKEGWSAAPGALPIEKQLDKSYMMQYEYDYDGEPMFIMAEGMSVGGNYDAAKMQALELAKQNLAGLIQSQVEALVKNSGANKQMDQGNVASISESLMASKNRISQNLGRVIVVTEMYRTVNGRNREVLVRVAYSSEKAKDVAKQAIRQDLESKGNDLHEMLDKVMQ